MSLWKRGRRYWTLFKHHGVLYRKPLCPPGETRATTDKREATRLERQVIDDAIHGRLSAKKGPSRLFEACDAFIESLKATANRERTVTFNQERLTVVRRHFKDVPLMTITRETIEAFQARRKADGASPRTINMDVAALRQVLKRYGYWKRLEDHVKSLTESGGVRIGRVLTNDERTRLFETAKTNTEWEHVYCAAVLAANTSMRGVEIKHIRRMDVDVDKAEIHIRHSKNDVSRRVIPLNAPALEAVMRMLLRADTFRHTEPTHYLWFATACVDAPVTKIERLQKRQRIADPTKPAQSWDNAWRALRKAAGLPGLRFHDIRHTVVTELLEAGVPDHVVESITGHVSRKMLEHYSHIRGRNKRDALDQLDESRKERTLKGVPS